MSVAAISYPGIKREKREEDGLHDHLCLQSTLYLCGCTNMQIRTKATQRSQSSLWLCSGLELLALPSTEVLPCTGPSGRFSARPSQFIGSGVILCALLHYSPHSGHSFPLTSPWPLPLRASVVLCLGKGAVNHRCILLL